METLYVQHELSGCWYFVHGLTPVRSEVDHRPHLSWMWLVCCGVSLVHAPHTNYHNWKSATSLDLASSRSFTTYAARDIMISDSHLDTMDYCHSSWLVVEEYLNQSYSPSNIINADVGQKYDTNRICHPLTDLEHHVVTSTTSESQRRELLLTDCLLHDVWRLGQPTSQDSFP